MAGADQKSFRQHAAQAAQPLLVAPAVRIERKSVGRARAVSFSARQRAALELEGASGHLTVGAQRAERAPEYKGMQKSIDGLQKRGRFNRCRHSAAPEAQT